MIRTVELFAGTQSFSIIAALHGCATFAVDREPFAGIDYVADIGAMDLLMELPYIPDVIWASPDCATYSKAAGARHRKKTVAVSDYAEYCDAVNAHFLGEIERRLKVNPDLIYFIENPQGQFRHMGFIKSFMSCTGGIRREVCYCQYGYPVMKPTDIFTNSKSWVPRPMCRNGNPDCHHERSPSHSVTLSKLGRRARSKIPQLLMFEIVESFL